MHLGLINRFRTCAQQSASTCPRNQNPPPSPKTHSGTCPPPQPCFRLKTPKLSLSRKIITNPASTASGAPNTQDLSSQGTRSTLPPRACSRDLHASCLRSQRSHPEQCCACFFVPASCADQERSDAQATVLQPDEGIKKVQHTNPKPSRLSDRPSAPTRSRNHTKPLQLLTLLLLVPCPT